MPGVSSGGLWPLGNAGAVPSPPAPPPPALPGMTALGLVPTPGFGANAVLSNNAASMDGKKPVREPYTPSRPTTIKANPVIAECDPVKVRMAPATVSLRSAYSRTTEEQHQRPS